MTGVRCLITGQPSVPALSLLLLSLQTVGFSQKRFVSAGGCKGPIFFVRICLNWGQMHKQI